MAGDPADLSVYVASDVNHDLTYYGNGCFGIPGSFTPCESRIVTTSDGEDLEIGTYYHFQAATAGSGGASLATDNTNAPDTFCPLGWQMPYGGTGGDYYDKSRSWRFLFNTYNYGNDDVNAVLSYPISEIRSGNMDSAGHLNRMTQVLNHWTITNEQSIKAYKVDVWGGNLISSVAEVKRLYYPSRCNSGVNILNLKHNWYILKS